jgi:hypothetical protein
MLYIDTDLPLAHRLSAMNHCLRIILILLKICRPLRLMRCFLPQCDEDKHVLRPTSQLLQQALLPTLPPALAGRTGAAILAA